MKIVAYQNTRAPDGYQVLALIFHADGSVHPVHFHGRDVDQVKASAETWYAEELAKVERQRQGRRALPTRPPVAS